MKFKEALAKFLFQIGISADFLTWLGLCLALFCGGLIFFGKFFWAGGFLLLSGFCDLLDGAVARASGKASVFGGILDSSLDRYGDGFVLGALAVYGAYYHRLFFSALALVALLGSFAVSYVRARAECEIESCRVGFWERGERLVFLALGLLLNNVLTALLILAAGTQYTVWQRLSYAQNSRPYPDRRSPSYGWKIAALVFLILWLRF